MITTSLSETSPGGNDGTFGSKNSGFFLDHTDILDPNYWSTFFLSLFGPRDILLVLQFFIGVLNFDPYPNLEYIDCLVFWGFGSCETRRGMYCVFQVGFGMQIEPGKFEDGRRQSIYTCIYIYIDEWFFIFKSDFFIFPIPPYSLFCYLFCY